MKRKIFSGLTFTAVAAMVLAAVLNTGSARADWYDGWYYDSMTGYDADVDDLPVDWSSSAGDWGVHGSDPTSRLRTGGSTTCRIHYDDQDAYSWTNYTARAITMGYLGGAATGGAYSGLQVRVQEGSPSSNYGVYIRSNGDFVIGQDGPAWNGPSTDLVVEAGLVDPFPASNAVAPIYLLEADVDGDVITARLYSSEVYQNNHHWSTLSQDPNPYDTFTVLQGEISVSDTVYDEGTVGVSWNHPGGNRVGNAIAVGVIPEPSTLALLGLAGLVLIKRRRV